MEEVVVAAGAETFSVKGHFPFTSLAFFDGWLPIQLLVTGIAEALCMMFFFLVAIDTGFYYD